MNPYPYYPMQSQMQQPQYNGYTAPQGQTYTTPQQQQMTPPTIHAEIIQIDGGKEAALGYPVAAGCSQMMMTKDEKYIFIKSAFANAPAQLDIYEKKPTITENTCDLSGYVKLDELEKYVNEIINKQRNNNNKPKENRNG